MFNCAIVVPEHGSCLISFCSRTIDNAYTDYVFTSHGGERGETQSYIGHTLIICRGIFRAAARSEEQTRLRGEFQRQSSIAFIGAAVAAAAAGLAGAWRTFRRQQRLSEMKTNFVSSVSHELRAPIASVRLMAEGLARGNVTEPARQREYFHFIVQECDRLGTLINNVLDFSQMEQGRKRS